MPATTVSPETKDLGTKDTGAKAEVTTRNTRQRQAIREAFEATGRPLDPNQVLQYASQRHSGLGIATVYRNIKYLVEEGWLTEVELPGQVTHYEISGKAHHHHFHCSQCKNVYEMDGCLHNVKALAPAGYVVTGHELVLYGVCQDCNRAARSQPRKKA